MNLPDFCGCCGRQMTGEGRTVNQFDSQFCNKCATHVEHSSRPPWERTYYALNNEADCPFQEIPGRPDKMKVPIKPF